MTGEICPRAGRIPSGGRIKPAGFDPLKGSLWHAYRRKSGSERKHLPDIDVVAAGGWKDTVSLKRSYQQADADTILSVVLGGGDIAHRR